MLMVHAQVGRSGLMVWQICLETVMAGGRLAESAVVCWQIGIDPPFFNRPDYNIYGPTAELECIPASTHFGLGGRHYISLGSNALTGRYPPEQAPDPTTRPVRGTAG